MRARDQFREARDARVAGRRLPPLRATRILRAVVICPSNPYLSIDPILSVPGFATQLRDATPRWSQYRR